MTRSRRKQPTTPAVRSASKTTPDLGFAGIRALRQMVEFCEAYQVRRLREAGYTWAEIGGWAGVSAQALHKKHAQALRDAEAASG